MEQTIKIKTSIENGEVGGIYYQLKNMHFSSPDMRNIYLKHAQECFDKRDLSASIYYQLEALCFNHNNTTNHDITTKQEKYEYLFLENIEGESHSNALLDFSKESCLIDGSEEKTAIKMLNLDEEIQKMFNFNKILPKEWNVIHICKGYDVNKTISKKSKILTTETSIFLTIIKHPRSKEFPEIQPIIQLCSSDVLRDFYEIHKNFKEIINFKEDGPRNKQQYNKDLKSFDIHIAECVTTLSKVLGPWVCLFTGNVNKNDIKIQQQFFTEIDTFCNKFNLSNNNRILLSMLVPNSKYLSNNDINDAVQQLNKNGNSRMSTTIYDFLIDQKKKTGYKYDLNSCILIIDELLDHLPWDMVNKNQEICRIPSYKILKQLYMKYKNEIVDGYLQVDVKNGNCIINPDKNLDAMEKRMKLFFNYWLPHWNCIYSDVPSKEKVEEIFSSDGIFVYCGHGSGMQCCNPYKTGIKRINKSVVFLFGCSSVKLRSTGLHAVFKGDHLYFHAGYCPAVIGLNNIGSDYPLDVYSTNILSTWIRSENKTHWNTFNKLQWKKGKLVTETNQQHKIYEYEPRLAAILSKIRSDSSQKIRDVIFLVYRGLPVRNTCV